MAQRKDLEDSQGLDGGDLGLGRGLKPGAIPKEDSDSETEVPQMNRTMIRVERVAYGKPASLNTSPNRSRSGSTSIDTENGGSLNIGAHPKKAMSFSEKLKSFKKSKSLSVETGQDNIPVTIYAEVPLGSSVRQQRKLFEQELEDIFQQKGFLVQESSQQGMFMSYVFMDSAIFISVIVVCLPMLIV